MEEISDTVYKVIKYGILATIAIGFSVLLVTSILVHDIDYIKKHPKFFVSETLIMAFLTTVPIVYLSILRGANKQETINGSALIFIKILLLHIGFQLSGVYSVIFPNSP